MSTTRNRRRAPQPRKTSSFFGTIKSFVSAPLAWLSDAGDTGSKRQHVGNGYDDDDSDSSEGGGRRGPKRMRVDGPGELAVPAAPGQQQQQYELPPPPQRERPKPYLDPPSSVFAPKAASYGNLQNIPERALRPTRSVTMQPVEPSMPRRTISPLPSRASFTAAARNMPVSMSVDPPHVVPATTTMSTSSLRDLGGSTFSLRDDSPQVAAVGSGTGGSSMGPTSFRMRTSLPPTLSRLSLAPRDPSEPPPLSALVSNPSFVRAPTEMMRSATMQPNMTLGSYMETRRLVSGKKKVFFSSSSSS
jgi:nucleoporin NUP1